MAAEEGEEYLLGINQTEFARLQFQHGVWKETTDRFLARTGIAGGWKCLDVGAGPGFVAMDLRERVGESGEVTALEPSALFLRWFDAECARKGWQNVRIIHATVEEADLPAETYDLIFIRWVIAFVPDPAAFIARLARALRPGGVIAIQDYYYEGLSLFPRGGAFDAMPDIVRAYYRSGGGDAYVTARIPPLLRRHNIEIMEFTPQCIAGGPSSAIMEWAHRFFVPHIPLMAARGIITSAEADALLADWHAHRANPDALFFSPLVVSIAGRAPRDAARRG